MKIFLFIPGLQTAIFSVKSIFQLGNMFLVRITVEQGEAGSIFPRGCWLIRLIGGMRDPRMQRYVACLVQLKYSSLTS